MSEDHSAAAVSLEVELVEGITRTVSTDLTFSSGQDLPLGHVLILQVGQVRFPLVTNNLEMLAKYILENEMPYKCKLTFPQEKQRTGIIILVS